MNFKSSSNANNSVIGDSVTELDSHLCDSYHKTQLVQFMQLGLKGAVRERVEYGYKPISLQAVIKKACKLQDKGT